MKKKQVLKVKRAHNDEIVKMKEANSIYVDNKYYREQMKERIGDASCSSFPVRIQAVRIGWILHSDDEVDGRYFLQEILRNEDVSYYNIKSLRMIIEFLYLNIRFSIFLLLLPCYLCHQILFVVVALVNERLRDNFEIDRERNMVICDDVSASWLNALTICLASNALIVFFQACINFFMFRMMGFVKYFMRIWSLVDVTLLLITIVILSEFFSHSYSFDNGTFSLDYDSYKQHTQSLRIMFMVGQVLLFTKTLQFITMIDWIAPLVSIARKILDDIKGFIVILLIISLTLAFAFYLLAQNQLNFDELTPSEATTIDYKTIVGSVEYVADMILGQVDQSGFSAGRGSMDFLLHIFFWVAAFAIMINMLNMLIAIMGNTFDVGNQSAE